MMDDHRHAVGGQGFDVERGRLAVRVALQGHLERAEGGRHTVETRGHPRSQPLGREAFKQVEFGSPIQRQEVDHEPDEFRAGPVVRHVADFLELLPAQ